MPHASSPSTPICRVDPSSTPASGMVEILRADEAVILHAFVPRDVVATIDDELAEPLEQLSAGSSHSSEHICKFHGAQTKRLTNMVVRSPTIQSLLDSLA